MRARIRGTEIYFDIDGAGLVPDGNRMRERPVAFLIHGGPGMDHSFGKAAFGCLAEGMQLVYFDHRGQGRSARGDPNLYTLEENVEDMEALRHYLGLGPIVSIGTSYGGMVAMAHAARYPEAVSHLILNVTASHAGLINRAREVVANRGSEEQITECDKLFGGLLDTPQKLRAYFEIMGPLYSVKGDAAGLRLGLDRAILTTEALNRAFAPDGFLHTFDLRTQLSSITAPTLILAGRHDWICAPEFSEEIHKLIPWSDLRIFEESGHFVATDEPQKLRDMISGFALSVPRRTTRWRNNCE